MRKIKKTLISSFLFILFSSSLSFALSVPPLDGPVVDLTNTLSASNEQTIETQLLQLEKETSNQVAVLIIPTLKGEVLESYSMKVAEAWELGQKNKNNGVLLLIVKKDRKLRIEVGYGLEPKLTDALSSYIINNEIVPQFKKSNYEIGILKGVQSIVGSIQDTYKPDLQKTSTDDSFPWIARLFMFSVWFVVVGAHTTNAACTKNIFVCALLYFFLMPFWFVFPMVIFGTFPALLIFSLYAIGFPFLSLFLRSSATGQKIFQNLTTSRSHKNSHWYSGLGHSIGRSVSRSSSSSSSFSGGGGSFGGGGSSGSW